MHSKRWTCPGCALCEPTTGLWSDSRCPISGSRPDQLSICSKVFLLPSCVQDIGHPYLVLVCEESYNDRFTHIFSHIFHASDWVVSSTDNDWQWGSYAKLGPNEMFLSAMTNHVKAAAFGCDSTLRPWNRWNTGSVCNMNQLPICDSDSTSWSELIVLVKVCQGFEGRRRQITWGGSVETPTTWRSHRVHPAYEGGSMTSWSCKEISTVTWHKSWSLNQNSWGLCFLTLRNVGVDHAPSITVGRRTCLHCNLACFNTPKTLHTAHGRTDMDGRKDLVGIQCRSTSSLCSNEQMEVSACSDLGCEVGTWPPRVPWTATCSEPVLRNCSAQE